MSLGAIFGAAVDVATRAAAGISAAGVTVGDYTPAGGVARPATHAAIRIDEVPNGNVQRPRARLMLFQHEISAEPTDGATFLDDATARLWTIRTAARLAATWRCEAWA